MQQLGISIRSQCWRFLDEDPFLNVTNFGYMYCLTDNLDSAGTTALGFSDATYTRDKAIG